MHTIDKKVPLPGAQNKKFPWGEMKVGDSILSTTSTQSALGWSARHWAVTNGKAWKFSTRKEGKGFRIWRVE